MAFRDNFSSVATTYARYRPTYPASLVDTLADLAPATDLAWDVGCGSGQLSVGLAGRFDRVIATDASPQQIAAATPHARLDPGRTGGSSAAEGRRGWIDYRVAPAEDSGLPATCASLVVVAQAAHWFDWPRFVAEAGRVARPGALVALLSYNDMRLEGALHAIVAPYRDAVEAHWLPEREIVANGYRDLVMPWPAVSAPAIELTAMWTADELLGYILTWSASQRFAKADPAAADAAVAALRERARELWPDGSPSQIIWPLTVKLARR